MKADNVILANNCVYSMDCEETGLNNNVIVCGGTGCGKTMSVSEPRLLYTNNSSLVITVTKRRLIEKYKPVFEKRGYAVMELNFAHPEKSSIGYDPLRYVNSDSDITFLSESIVLGTGKNMADPYWDEAAMSLLSAETAYIKTTKKDGTFADVLDLHDRLKIIPNDDIDNCIETTLDGMFNALEAKYPKCFAVSCWKTFKQTPSRTGLCIYSSLNRRLDKVFSKSMRKLMYMKKNVDFERLASQKTVLFIVTSPVNPAANSFVNIFYSSVFKQLFEFAENRPDGVLPVPVHVLCDDFAVGGRILNFAEYISIFREKRISVTLLIQSESQLSSMYGENNAVTIINNCDTYLYMGGMDLKTSKNISLRADVPLDEVMYMPIGDVIVFRRGQYPVSTKRYDIMNDNLYREVTRAYKQMAM